MIQVIIEGIASFIGGYFSQQTIQKTVSLKRFFLIIFILLLSVSFAIQIAAGGVIVKEIFFGLFVSFLGASVCTMILFAHAK